MAIEIKKRDENESEMKRRRKGQKRGSYSRGGGEQTE
jgi:hypothetical protein